MDRPRSPAWATCAAISLLATVLIACSPPQTGPLGGRATDLLWPAAANQVVRDYWAVNERAAMAHDLDRFAQAETGLLLEADRGQVQANKALAVPPIPKPRPLRRVTTYVPHQHRYPAQFLALLETVQVGDGGQLTTTPTAIYLHFVRPSSTDPWKADFYA